MIKAKSKGIIDCNISEKCKFICDYAFSGCTSLTSITMPNSVTSIGYDAFSDCTSLKTINYKGTEEQWFAISFIGGGVIKKCTINYNYS